MREAGDPLTLRSSVDLEGDRMDKHKQGPDKEPVVDLVELTEEEQRQVGGGMTDRGDTYSLSMTDRGDT